MFTEMRCAGSSPCTSTSYAPVQHRSRGQRPLVTSARAVELSTGARLAYSYALRMADAGSRRGQSLPRAAQSSANLPSTRTTSRDSAEAPSTVGCPPPRTELERRALSPSLLSGVTAANVAHYLAPGAAHASEVASGTYLDVLKSLLVRA